MEISCEPSGHHPEAFLCWGVICKADQGPATSSLFPLTYNPQVLHAYIASGTVPHSPQGPKVLVGPNMLRGYVACATCDEKPISMNHERTDAVFPSFSFPFHLSFLRSFPHPIRNINPHPWPPLGPPWPGPLPAVPILSDIRCPHTPPYHSAPSLPPSRQPPHRPHSPVSNPSRLPYPCPPPQITPRPFGPPTSRSPKVPTYLPTPGSYVPYL